MDAVYMKLFFSYRQTFEKLSDEDAGQLIKAMLRYAETGEAIPPTAPMADLAFDFIKAQIDRDKKAFADGGKGGRPRKVTEDTENENHPFENQKQGFSETETTVTENDNHPTQKPKPLKDKGIKDKGIKDKGLSAAADSACARAETPFGEVEIDPLIVKAQRELLGLTDTHYDLLRQYRDELGDDLVSHAIDCAVGEGVRKWNYVEAILLRYKSDGIKTVAEAKAASERRKQQRAKSTGKVIHAQQFTQRTYTDEQLGGEMSPLLAEAIKKVTAG